MAGNSLIRIRPTGRDQKEVISIVDTSDARPMGRCSFINNLLVELISNSTRLALTAYILLKQLFDYAQFQDDLSPQASSALSVYLRSF